MNEQRLYAVVLRLAAIHSGAVPADHGDKARAALLQLIQQGDSPLAERLHDDNAAKPYTISLIHGGRRGRDGAQHFGEGDTADWRFSLMLEPAFEAVLRRYLLDRNLPHVRIGKVRFAIIDAFASGTNHLNSGHTTIAELTDRWHISPEDLPRTLMLDFQSTTAFSLGRDPDTKEYRIRSQPDARILFSSLRKRWVKLGGADAGDAFDDWVSRHVEQESANIRNQVVYIKPRPVTGFIGQVTYRVYGTDLRWLAYLHLLADLTFWTGVGYQTTRGMGQTRRIPPSL